MKHPTRRATTAIAAALATLLITAGCDPSPIPDGRDDGGNSSPLIFAEVPGQNPPNVQKTFQPILDMLTKETGKEIRVIQANNYNAVIQGLLEGTIDIASLGPFPYLIATQQNARITVVAARVQEKGGSPGYQSYGITRAGSPITTLADFRGRKVCFVDPDSTSGYLYPSAGLLAAGINPERDVTPIFAGGHDASVLAVVNGQCDAGFAFDSMVDRQLIEQGLIRPGDITTVWQSNSMSDPIPGSPIVIANDLPEPLRQQLTVALQNKANADYLRAHSFCQGECAIVDEDAWGYVPTDDSSYDSVREVIRKVCKSIQHKSCAGG